MTNAIAKKIIAATLAVSTLTGTQALTVTAAVGTTAIASTIAATPAQAAGQCGARLSVDGVPANGLIYKLKKNRAERRAKRAWRAAVAGESSPSSMASLLGISFNHTNHPSRGLGTRYADLSKARNVVINCKGGGSMRCTVTATPCAW